MPYLEIVDILALCVKMVLGAESIHDFEIRRLLDSAIHLYLIPPPRDFTCMTQWNVARCLRLC